MTHHNCIALYFDGASRNNPRGPAGCGWSLYRMNQNADDQWIASGHKYLRYNVTSNQAEYYGLNAALNYILNNGLSCNELHIQGDSQLVIKHLTGEFEVRSDRLRPRYNLVKQKLNDIDKRFVYYNHVRRSSNREADALANKAIRIRRNRIYESRTFN